VTASRDGTARVWQADGSGTPVTLKGHNESVHSAAFSPDGQRVVTTSFDGTARVWRTDGSGTPAGVRGHENLGRKAAVRPRRENAGYCRRRRQGDPVGLG